MVIIVAVDDRQGMLFNHRRQSQDRVLREKILALTAESRLWMNTYSYGQFQDCGGKQITVDNEYLNKAAAGDYCFVEDQLVSPFEQKIEKIILCKWNRHYPSDFYFDVDVQGGVWHLDSTEEFQGFSHDKITMEVYTR